MARVRGREGIDLWADRFFKLKPESQRRRLRLLLQMMQASLSMRSVAIKQGAIFIATKGSEDAGTRYDRLLKQLFGMEFAKPAKEPSGRSQRPRSSQKRRARCSPVKENQNIAQKSEQSKGENRG